MSVDYTKREIRIFVEALKRERKGEVVGFRCLECGKVYSTLFTLKNHYKRNHLNGKCPICNKTYSSLIRHTYNILRNPELHNYHFVIKHAILYYLANKRAFSHDKELYMLCRDLTYYVLAIYSY